MQHARLMDTTTSLQAAGTISHIVSPSPSLPQHGNTEYDTILAEFPSVTRLCTSPRPVLHDVTHHIRITGPPIHAQARRLAPDRLRIARHEFEHMMEQGIIQPSDSQWSSLNHLTASGHHLYIWFQRRLQEIGDLAVTTGY